MSEWDGRPENPERDGLHFLHFKREAAPTVAQWYAAGYWHLIGNDDDKGPDYVSAFARYLGPCHAPAEAEKEPPRDG